MADIKKVLIVEDEIGVQITLEDRLTAEGYKVSVCGDGIKGEEIAKSGEHDLVLLDVMLPGRDGFTICRNLRKSGSEIPILMLTARNTNIDTVMGLKVGADDYLAKPFDMQILLARIEALLRRAASGKNSAHAESGDIAGSNGTKSGGIIKFGDFVLDMDRGILEQRTGDGNSAVIELNAQEYKLLVYLVLHNDRIISRNAVLDDVWGYESEITTRTVDVHIAKLRQRLGESERPKHILTYRGRGYKFELKN